MADDAVTWPEGQECINSWSKEYPNATCTSEGVTPPYGHPTEIVFLLLTMLCLCLLSSLCWFVTRNRGASVVKKSSYVNLLAVFGGFASLLVAQLLWPLQNSNALCYAKPWFVALGFGLIAGAMVSRIYNTYYVFALANNPTRELREIMAYKSPRALERRDRLMRFLFAGIITGELLLILLMTTIPDIQPTVTIDCCNSTNSTGMDIKVQFNTCNLDEVFGYFAVILNAVPLAAGLYWVVSIMFVLHKVKRLARERAAMRDGEMLDATGLILLELQDRFALLRPVLTIIAMMGAVGMVLVVISYSDLPTESVSSRWVYYIVRCVCFLFVIMASLGLLFYPIILKILQEQRGEASGSGSSNDEATSPSARKSWFRRSRALESSSKDAPGTPPSDPAGASAFAAQELELGDMDSETCAGAGARPSDPDSSSTGSSDAGNAAASAVSLNLAKT